MPDATDLEATIIPSLLLHLGGDALLDGTTVFASAIADSQRAALEAAFPAARGREYDWLFRREPSLSDTLSRTRLQYRAPRRNAEPPSVGGYVYERRVGQGAAADVHRYRERSTQRLVAVKVSHAGSAHRAVLRHELACLARADHAGITRVEASGTSPDGREYLLMAWCAGPDLATRYRRGPLSVTEVLRVGEQLADALGSMHDAGMAHGDVKPANVLTRGDGSVVLCDLGQATGDALVPPEDGFSIPWCPPEQLSSQTRATARGDVYSLAATLHTLLAGESPFVDPGETPKDHEVLDRVSRGAATPLARPDVPAALTVLLRESMALAPEQRPKDAGELGDRLRALGAERTRMGTRDPVAGGGRSAEDEGDELDRWVRRAERDPHLSAVAAEGEERLSRVTGRVRERSEIAARSVLASAAAGLGAHEPALGHAEAALELVHRVEDPSDDEHLRCELQVARARLALGWSTTARDGLETAHDRARASGREELAAGCAAELAELAVADHRYRDALRHLDAATDAGTRPARTHLLRGMCARELGRREESVRELVAAADAARDDLTAVADAQYQLALTYAQIKGHQESARELLSRAGASYRHVGEMTGVVRCLFEVARNDVARHRPQAAVRTYGQLRTMLAGLDDPQRLAECEVALARVLIDLGSDTDARAGLERALETFAGLGSAGTRGEADCELELAELAGRSRLFPTADEHFHRAFEGYRAMGLPLEAARAELRRARLLSVAARHRDGAVGDQLRRRAAEIALPAALALDAGRYGLDRAHERQSWSANVAGEVREEAYRLVFESGDAGLLADLILDARATGTYVLARPVGLSHDDSALHDEDADVAAGPALVASVVWTMLGRESLRLEKGPLVVAPHGGIALRSALADAKERFGEGVRSPVAVRV